MAASDTPTRAVWTLLALVCATVSLAAVSLVGWSLDAAVSPLERVQDDGGLLATSALVGGVAGAAAASAVASSGRAPTRWLLVAAGLGVVPATAKASAFFTSLY